jgi:hypothetical protein
MPLITLQRISTDRDYTLQGRSGLAGALIQIDCWADAPEYAGTYGTAKLVADTVRLKLESYLGDMGLVRIREVTIATDSDMFETMDRTRRVSADYRIYYDEVITLPPPPVIDLIVDTVPGAALAFSARRLTRIYGGQAVNAELDDGSAQGSFGFAPDNSFDGAAYDAFVGGHDGYSVIWHDQSGYFFDASQTRPPGFAPVFTNVGQGFYGPRGSNAQGSQTRLDLYDSPILQNIWARPGGATLLMVVGLLSIQQGTAALMGKGNPGWCWYSYVTPTGEAAALYLAFDGSDSQGQWGTTESLNPGVHLIDLQYDCSDPDNVPTMGIDGVTMTLTSSVPYGGTLASDVGGIMELMNSDAIAELTAG